MNQQLQKRILSSLILIPITFFFIIQGSIFFIFFLILFFLATSFEWFNMTKKNNIIRFFGIVFLFFSFSSAFFVREDYGSNGFLFFIIVCIFTDIGGYVFGKTFKGPKLTSISPNKTYTGVIGSFLFSLIAGLVFIKYFWSSETYKTDIDQFLVLLIIITISLVSQIGDLIISYFKRKAKLKDTGKILPGHGGLLDRIDGLIFVIPSIYLLSL
ncbi:phosphatidate cytidylyltransferase [Candidatus Pelagibacter communis]|uniref:phosphatidate cytidylyltransferase n=1 Tax=Pelagibacter ubique TaxID=198252 RepID=UPI00094CC143|nr:phosphatidate cytidylyltransferase [Candidatus Pelagibacter ubique]|tara:strand:+ start:1856 stop:2494 length:639 start_codon:yes stop_codon:yes gene_type:complete